MLVPCRGGRCWRLGRGRSTEGEARKREAAGAGVEEVTGAEAPKLKDAAGVDDGAPPNEKPENAGLGAELAAGAGVYVLVDVLNTQSTTYRFCGSSRS